MPKRTRCFSCLLLKDKPLLLEFLWLGELWKEMPIPSPFLMAGLSSCCMVSSRTDASLILLLVPDRRGAKGDYILGLGGVKCEELS